MIGRLDRVIGFALIAAIGGCAEKPANRISKSGDDGAAAPLNQPADIAVPATDGGTGAGNRLDRDAPAARIITAVPSTPDATSAPVATSDVVLAVEGEGLRLFNRASSAASAIAFGSPAANVLSVLERLRGPASKGTNQDCGAGPVEYANWPDGLSLVFQRNRFVGWSLNKRAAGVTGTSSGIGPGSTRAELDAAYGSVQVRASSIGQEFSTANFAGVIDGPNMRSKITDMWSGISCVAR